MKPSSFFRLLLGCFLLACTTLLPADIPRELNVQGRVIANGVNFDGNGQFKFALIKPDATSTYWSNDGSSNAGSEPVTAVTLPVAQGRYSVNLGDSTLTNMDPLPLTAFDNPDISLRIWFDDGVNGFQQLSPDQRIVSSAFAFKAGSLADGAVTSSMLGHDLQLGSGANTGRLTLWNEPFQLNSMELDATTARFSTYGADGLENSRLWGGGWGELLLNDETVQNNTTARLEGLDGGTLELRYGPTLLAYLNADSTSGGELFLDQLDGETGVQLKGDTGGAGSATIHNTDGSPAINLSGSNTTLTLFQDDSQLGLTIVGDETGASSINLFDDDGTPSVFLDGATNSAIFFKNENTPSILLDGQTNAATFQKDNGNPGVTIKGDSSGGGKLTLFSHTLQEAVAISGSSHQASFRQSNGTAALSMNFGGGGSLWLNDDEGDAVIKIDAEPGVNGSHIELGNTGGTTRLLLDGSSTDNSGEVLFKNHAGNDTLQLLGSNGANRGGLLQINDNDASVAARLREDEAEGGGELVLYDDDGNWRMFLEAQQTSSAGAAIALRNASGNETATLEAEDTTEGGGQLTLRDDSGDWRILLEAQQTATEGARLALRDAAGQETIVLDSEYSGGPSRVITGSVQITGGSDLSEQFNINSPSPPEPGTLVSIDPDRPGELRTSTTAYDRTVAGVISGAGGVRPGMLMGQADTLADGTHPVALTGRVYCHVNCSNGSIQPGDLLTTSATPGEAMKATDPAKSQGAIIGKAMTRLEKESGLVLVLISLQ